MNKASAMTSLSRAGSAAFLVDSGTGGLLTGGNAAPGVIENTCTPPSLFADDYVARQQKADDRGALVERTAAARRGHELWILSSQLAAGTRLDPHTPDCSMLPVCRLDHRGQVGLLIYLDICCFNRPFDQQSQTLVRLQTEAKLAVQRGVRDGQLRLAWSAVLDLENAGNPDAERAEAITLWRDLARVDVSTTPAVEAIAEAIAERGVKAMDALHVASAITAGATWLLTTDLKLIRKMHGDDRIVVADPIDFIRYWQGDDDENRV